MILKVSVAMDLLDGPVPESVQHILGRALAIKQSRVGLVHAGSLLVRRS